MSNEELMAQAQKTSPYIKIAGGLWFAAFMIVMVAAIAWITLAVMTGDFFSNSKAVRDAAEAGTGILSQQSSIEAVKVWLLLFAFPGFATFIAGFGFAFVNILQNVKLRGNTMVAVLPALRQRRDAA